MGTLNKILPEFIQPTSRNIGFIIKSILYKITSFTKEPSKNPIFILGNQKSGTSVIGVLLGKLTNKPTAIDLFYSGFRYQLFVKWKRGIITTSKFINKNKLEFSKEIIKEPHLSVFYKELKMYYPNAKFIMIIRHPLSNIRSILDRLNIKGNNKELSFEERNRLFHSWKLVFNNGWIGGHQINYIEDLAERWNIITDIYLKNQENIVLVKYEDFLQDKYLSISNLAKSLSLNKKSKITHLLNKQYQPKGSKKNIDLQVFFGEKNYHKILDICKYNMSKLGY
ncbi:MAG: sulfotransferase [Bacteroidota bacterium]|nr:sulfotransferase [Bacteroidota bacterium]